MKIVSYMTVSGSDYNIDDRVNEAIEMGWQPLGGVSRCITKVNDEYIDDFTQAMVMYADGSPVVAGDNQQPAAE